jgi:hypothetical protein
VEFNFAMRVKSVPKRNVRPVRVLRHPWMDHQEQLEIQRQRETIIRNERRRLLQAIFLIASDLQVHPVYPSDTDDLEWRDPTLDHESPHSPEDYDDSI